MQKTIVVWGLVCLLSWLTSPGIGAQTRQEIRQAQEHLKKAGGDPGPVDGLLGPHTQEALRQYQAAHALAVTGVLDEATVKSLQPAQRPAAPALGRGNKSLMWGHDAEWEKHRRNLDALERALGEQARRVEAQERAQAEAFRRQMEEIQQAIRPHLLTK